MEFILGPILPIVNVESVNEAISVIKDGAKPLSMYIFSEKKDKVKQLIEVRILLLFSKIYKNSLKKISFENILGYFFWISLCE